VGVPQQPLVFYFGATGGGVWKTTDAGNSWRNVSDGFFQTGSVGSIAVAPSDPNVLYAGMGEAPVRGVMTSHGDGVYQSLDGGQSWQHRGLEKVRQISKVRIHPRDPDWVYVAAQGSPYQPTAERGVFRSKDGGKSWQKVLFVDERSGACDLSMDPNNPRVLYAAFWDHQRLPWKVISGGPGSSIWKSTDGGDNWTKLQEGLPEGIMGKIGITVSPANPSRVWAIIESDEGGLYRSDDGGQHWKLINDDRKLRARSWYYMHVFADPLDANKVYVLNAPFFQSIDGGKSFQSIATPHGDNHDLWIHPDNPQVMINANDGGANISFNGGKSWSSQANQPTAQFYRVNADNRFPYYLYGGQQDNTSVAIPSQTNGSGIRNEDFYSVGGCESAYCAFDPDDPSHVYAGCYQGIISEYNVALQLEKDIMAYPDLGLGSIPSQQKYRFNWNAPILVSQHDPSVLYHAGNLLFKSTDRGLSWEIISPDLTRNLPQHLEAGGGPITNEAAGGEIYHTIMYVAESPQEAQTLWVGADDGLLHLSQDGGQTWQNITPPALQETEGMVNSIELSPHQNGVAYVAVTRYKFNDFTPYLYYTADFGQSWELRSQGIAEEAHVRVVRCDPEREGLLYAGTETGLYLSFDDGKQWQKFQLNLPIVPITDLKVHHNDLIAATQGRAFWILDDLTPLHQLQGEGLEQSWYAFPPREVKLFGGPRIDTLRDRGTNPESGAVFRYYLSEEMVNQSEPLVVKILDEDKQLIRSFQSDLKPRSKQAPKEAGMNQLVWNLRHPSFELPKGLMVIGGNAGPKVGPGTYEVRLVMGEDSIAQNFVVRPDPRQDFDEVDYVQVDSLKKRLQRSVEELYQAVHDLRDVRGQISSLLPRIASDSSLHHQAETLSEMMEEQEQELVQARQKTFQDVVNYPNQLDAQLLHILNLIDNSPPPLTEGQRRRAGDVLRQWRGEQARLQVLREETARLNAALLTKEILYLQPATTD
jgi:photosystem II stability/assembly factor-like uncharacterized protein